MGEEEEGGGGGGGGGRHPQGLFKAKAMNEVHARRDRAKPVSETRCTDKQFTSLTAFALNKPKRTTPSTFAFNNPLPPEQNHYNIPEP
jgi:hypothetical protein